MDLVMYLSDYAKALNNLLWSWPLIAFFMLVGLLATVSLKFVQFRYFFKSWQLVFSPKEQLVHKTADMSPFQAFMNALSTSIGNGSLAGMATAVHEGGPGAAFWIFILGFFTLPIRFCEVYLSSAFDEGGGSVTSGGPMVYLKHVPGRYILPGLFAFFCLLMSFASGNAMQSNSVSSGLQSVLAVDQYVIATGLALFVLYIILGGAKRIVKFSEAVVPLKVGLFFVTMLLLVFYNISAFVDTIKIIVTSAFEPQAIKGALIGTSMQTAIRFGMSRSLNASEVALGTAGVFFGSTGSKHPVENGIMSMVSAFISTYLVSFVIAFSIVLTGVWTTPVTSIALTTAAYSTLYGSFASWIVTLLSITFGVGVLVSYAYVGKECWSYLTNGRYLHVYSAIYVALAFFGSIAKVQLVWDSIDIVNAGLIGINLYAIFMLMPKIRKGVQAYMNADTSS